MHILEMQRSHKKHRGGFFDNLQSETNKLESQRLMSDVMSSQNKLTVNNLYNTVGDVEYGGQFSTLKGGSQGELKGGSQGELKGGSQGELKGGCFTCPKGQGKIIAVVKSFSVIIPKYYKQYKAQKEKPKTKAAKPTKAAKAAKKTKPRKIKGGIFSSSDWDGQYEWKPNPNADEKLYSNDLYDLAGLNMNTPKSQGIFQIDNTLSGLTSVIV